MHARKLLGAMALMMTASLPLVARDRAVLIGVDQYKNLPPENQLVGCVEDALDMAQFLQSKMNFSKENITLLLNEQATAQTIQQSLNQLADETQPGDRIFVLYSGHGSRADDDNNDEADKFDETIAPYDAVATRAGTNQIRDDFFGQWIAKLAGRRIVMLFDSCHSGTISRAAFEKTGDTKYVRYLPPLEDEPTSRGGKDFLNLDGDLGEDHRPQQLRQANVVILSAASNVQKAHLVKLGNKQRGALVVAFAESQQTGLLKLSELQQSIIQKIQTWQRSGKLPGAQTPQFEIGQLSLNSQTLFGEWGQPANTAANTTAAPTVSPAETTLLFNPNSKMQVSIQTTLNKRVYYEGETIAYKVTSNRAGYLYLIVFSADKNASLLFPNVAEKQNQIQAGAFQYPQTGFDFDVSASGMDVTVALLSSHPISGLDGSREKFSWPEMFERLKLKQLQSAIEASAKSRGQSVRVTDIDWQAASVEVDTRKK
jgi:metacaspase-1